MGEGIKINSVILKKNIFMAVTVKSNRFYYFMYLVCFFCIAVLFFWAVEVYSLLPGRQLCLFCLVAMASTDFNCSLTDNSQNLWKYDIKVSKLSVKCCGTWIWLTSDVLLFWLEIHFNIKLHLSFKKKNLSSSIILCEINVYILQYIVISKSTVSLYTAVQ